MNLTTDEKDNIIVWRGHGDSVQKFDLTDPYDREKISDELDNIYLRLAGKNYRNPNPYQLSTEQVENLTFYYPPLFEKGRTSGSSYREEGLYDLFKAAADSVAATLKKYGEPMVKSANKV